MRPMIPDITFYFETLDVYEVTIYVKSIHHVELLVEIAEKQYCVHPVTKLEKCCFFAYESSYS